MRMTGKKIRKTVALWVVVSQGAFWVVVKSL